MGWVQQENSFENETKNSGGIKMYGIKADEDELLINDCIKCESEEDYYMILDELYRDRREGIENENVD